MGQQGVCGSKLFRVLHRSGIPLLVKAYFGSRALAASPNAFSTRCISGSGKEWQQRWSLQERVANIVVHVFSNSHLKQQKRCTHFCWTVEVWAVQKYANFQFCRFRQELPSAYLHEKKASTQPRTSLWKFWRWFNSFFEFASYCPISTMRVCITSEKTNNFVFRLLPSRLVCFPFGLVFLSSFLFSSPDFSFCRRTSENLKL